MTDWVRVHAYAQDTYVQTFPITSFLVSGVSHYTELDSPIVKKCLIIDDDD